ncbi:MAG: C10 family peptidase, partial [Clostridia bacterium]|nr:C10 family peptidase [Clostridia bacterium]
MNLTEGALSVSVVHDVTAPVITLSADTETVVLQTTLTATVDDGSKIEYRIGEFGLWKEYTEPIIASLNETYYFMAADEAGNIGTNEITFANIDTSGVLLSTLWTQKGICPMGGNTTILYNEYTPLDPSVTPKAHSLTGCVNTAAGQLIYYFIEKGWLDLPLTLKESDEYTSKHKATDEDGEKIVIEIKADGTTPGTLSFAEINAMLSDYQLDSAEHAAALLYAIGVVLESKYSANSTGTSWNGAFFKRAGFEGGTMGGPYYGQYYWGDMDDEMQCTISDAGFEVLIENLEAGLPVGATYPGHAFVIDGYDRESDRFHVNFGWGGNQATRWYTRDEIHELNFEAFVYDLNPEYMETFTVTDARVYGTGTMIRAFEKAAGMIGDNTVAFDPSIAGKTVELLNHITLFDEVVTVKDFNMNVLVTKSDGGERGYGFYAEHIDVFEPTDPVTALTFHASGGSLIVSTEKEFNYAFQMEEALSCTVDVDDMLIYGGKTSEGTSAAAVLQALQTCRSENLEVSDDLLDPNGWSYNGSVGEDVFRLSNSSLAVGKVSLGAGDDVLTLAGHSRLYGNIDAGDGNDSITVDSTSFVNGDLSGKCKLNFVLAERDDHAMFTIRSSASGLCADATVSVDMKNAELGTYTLISAATGATGISDLQNLAVTVTGNGEADFTLSVNGTSSSDYADLIFENDSLKLQVKKESLKPKWTYLVYMAADNDLCYSALYDIVSM